jgi:hypothetical protein
MKIPCYKSFLYSEVHIVTEYREGAVFKTAPTGYYILNKEVPFLKENFITSSISTKLYRQDIIELEVKSAEYFNQGV